MAALRPAPDTPPRAVLYLRQSVARDDSISLELQEAAGRSYCSRQGYQVVAVESDPGISGRTWNRPAVQRVMSMIDEGRADVVILWKWSRLSRSRRDWAIAVDKVEAAGGRIESATEQVDVSTATGRLARGVLAEFAAFESDRIGEVWKEVHASRLKSGRTPTGLPKYGYEWDPDQKIHMPDAVTGPVLADVYERYVAGESMLSLASSLNTAGHRTVKGNHWSSGSLRRVLDSGFAAGFIPWHDQLHEGVHEPLINQDLWQQFLDARVARRTYAPRSHGTRYLLTGMIRCGICGGSMSGNQGNGRGSDYRCNFRKTRGPEACSATSVSLRMIEDKVIVWVSEVAGDVQVQSDAAAARNVRRLSAEAEVQRLSGEVQRIDEAMQRLTVQVAEGLVDPGDYGPARQELKRRQDQVQEQLLTQSRLVRRAQVDHSEVARDLMLEWNELPLEHKRNMLRSLLAEVRVTAGGRKSEKGRAGSRSLATVEVLPEWSEEYVRL